MLFEPTVPVVVTPPNANDREQPDEARCAAAIHNLNEVFANIRNGCDVEDLGLGKEAVTALAVLRCQHLSDETAGGQHDSSTFFAVPLDLLHEAVVSVHLPNRDRALLKRLRDKNLIGVGLPADRKRTDGRLRSKLQSCTITLGEGFIRLHNRVDELECEVRAPAQIDHRRAANEGVAFTLPFHIMWELYDRLRGVPRSVSWARERQRKQLIFFRYDADLGILKIIDGTTRLVRDVEPLPASETALADLAVDAERRTVACEPLADAMSWVLRLSSKDRNIVQEDRRIVADCNPGQITYADDSIGAGELVIKADVARSLQYALKRMGGSAEMRMDANNHFIEKGVATLSFERARPGHRDYENVEKHVRANGACVAVNDVEFLPALIIADAIGAEVACLEVLVGANPQLKLTTTGRDKKGREFSGVIYTPTSALTNVACLIDHAVEIRISEWLLSIGFQEGKTIEIIVNEDRTGALLTHRHNGRHVTGLFATVPAQSHPCRLDAEMIADKTTAAASRTLSASEIGDLLVLATSGGPSLPDHVTDAVDEMALRLPALATVNDEADAGQKLAHLNPAEKLQDSHREIRLDP